MSNIFYPDNFNELNTPAEMLGVFGYVYKITHKISGKSYIGITTRTVWSRWLQHRNHKAKAYISKLTRAVEKYGDTSFDISILGWASSQESLGKFEEDAVVYFNSIANGYNQRPGGIKYTKHTESTINKIKAAKVLHPNIFTEETRKKLSASLSGLRKSEQHRLAVIKANTGNKRSTSAKLNMKKTKREVVGKPIYSLDINNVRIDYGSIAEAVEKTGNIKQSISSSLKQKWQTKDRIYFYATEICKNVVPYFLKYKINNTRYKTLLDIAKVYNKTEAIIYRWSKRGIVEVFRGN